MIAYLYKQIKLEKLTYDEVIIKRHDLKEKLDAYIASMEDQLLCFSRVTITAYGLDSLADDVAQHQEAILALQSANSK